MKSFKIELYGTQYQGLWLSDGGTLKLKSDYGQYSAPLNGQDPSQLARKLLAQVVAVQYR